MENLGTKTASRRAIFGGVAAAATLAAFELPISKAQASVSLPKKVVEFKIGNRIMQSFMQDRASGDWYVSYGPYVGDTNIFHCDSNGNVIDVMTMVGGGHGSQMALYNNGGTIEIWTGWKSAKDKYRIKYRPGTMQSNDPNVSKMPIINPDYHFFSVDQAVDRVAIFGPGSSTSSTMSITYVLRRLSEYLQGVGSPIATKVVNYNTAAGQVFQGFTTANGKLYVGSGGLPGAADPAIFSTLWKSSAGTPMTYFDAYQTGFGYPLANFGGYWEMEGLCTIGNKVMFGINSKSGGVHTNTVYEMPPGS